ncbi:hypothetical protein BV57P2_00046 [Phocaeicola phage BV57P2]|nr:hypothetical protein BV57P2_00046 [Phocaeicola phage BV57P2]
MLTFEKAKELFVYDRETGIIKWKRRTSNNQRKNLVAGSTRSNDGYIQIGINGEIHLAHRIAVLLTYGFCDDRLQVDHINHIRDDNRLVNLRLVTRTDNLRNQPRRRNNTTGIMGVVYHKAKRKYMARIRVDGVNIYLGIFDTLGEAAKARKDADIRYKYNANHGATKIKDYAK